MHFAILGSGAVGGYYGALLARSGQRVSFVARGAHLRAIRERGLMIWSPLGDFTVRAQAEDDAAAIGPVDVVLLAVKTYDNAAVLPMLPALVGPSTVVITLQNGVDSPDEVAAVVGKERVLGGPTYIAAARSLPGLVEQTGTHRRIVFGEAFGGHGGVSQRVSTIADALTAAGIQAETVANARVPLWEKFIYLAPFAAFTGAARLPIGPLWSDPSIRAQFMAAVGEVEAVARAEGVPVREPADLREYVSTYVDALPPHTKSSLLIDLQQGKRTEVESLAGSVVRRGCAAGVPTPIMSALYAVLKPWGQLR
ncbi:MAG TPA: 2-dehydropantoate 2-reductase [Vicinamibacterales bacterium]|nr:2-dehydropantoate 2-reductase [Vicinamibacterales bacterium]HOG27743.1 2-dehydropantoate 2-reductase [Vicinamibacterales bacterium]HOQ59854.1 2-dehydropantoate 2-reductase [Vicinamibacterales bacterium]HPK70615.1 2-dehydropantoate 2-reductase [Vicinamibacterales bacterium]HPW19219.1 2-dehydropantoate 2-reductase [Vicinamibacterales bacterium]